MLTRKGKIVALVLAMLFIVSLLIITISQNFLESEMLRWMENFGSASIFILSAVLDFVPQVITAHVVLVVSLIAGYDPITAFLIVAFGSVVGTTAAFEVGRHYGKEYVDGLIDKKEEHKLELFIHKYGKWGMLLSSFIPFLPYIPVIFGAFGMRRKTFLMYGLIPRVISHACIAAFPALYFIFF